MIKVLVEVGSAEVLAAFSMVVEFVMVAVTAISWKTTWEGLSMVDCFEMLFSWSRWIWLHSMLVTSVPLKLQFTVATLSSVSN